MMNNPYPKKLVDEVSGVEVPDQRHEIWNEGYKAARKEIIEGLRGHWIGYDTSEAPDWVYLRFGGTQADWENLIGKP